jgi:Sir2- and TIR-associating SLOG family
MIQQAGICVFICGLREASGAPVIAGGVMEELESAKRLQRILLPIGATGGAAQTIWKQVGKELNKWCPHISREDYARLNDAKQKPKALADIVGRVIAAADKAPPTTRKINTLK